MMEQLWAATPSRLASIVCPAFPVAQEDVDAARGVGRACDRRNRLERHEATVVGDEGVARLRGARVELGAEHEGAGGCCPPAFVRLARTVLMSPASS